MSNFLSKLKSFVLIVLTFVLANVIAGLLSGLLAGLGGNISLVGLDRISFDPLITIAYIILFHYVSHFLALSPKVAYTFFLFTLILSFAMNFIQGSLLLIILLTLLKKFKLIGETSTSTA